MPDKTQITVTVEGQKVIVPAKTFSTGSTGFYAQTQVVIDGIAYKANIQIINTATKRKGAAL